MRAVADSNLSRMAELWGTSAGPVARTQPPDYQRRVQVIYAYLRGTSGRVVGELERHRDRVVLQVEITRTDCRRTVPMTVVRQPDGTWILSGFDLDAIGTPGRPCPSEDRRPPGLE
jgi:hypothetical protein